ncbi:MAG TPA: hypothetical protein DEP13_01210, partial [Gammaproteobacteria bacterium]|nr:hypothetical protein [Gammaproteobacteria bacterium]
MAVTKVNSRRPAYRYKSSSGSVETSLQFQALDRLTTKTVNLDQTMQLWMKVGDRSAPVYSAVADWIWLGNH